MTEPHVVVHGAGLVGGFLGGASRHPGAPGGVVASEPRRAG